MQQIAAGAVEIVPALAFLDDRLEVLLPDGTVLHGILDHRAGQARRDVRGSQLALAEVRGERPAARRDRDRLRCRERRRRALQLRLAVLRLPLAQLTEDGDDT